VVWVPSWPEFPILEPAHQEVVTHVLPSVHSQSFLGGGKQQPGESGRFGTFKVTQACGLGTWS
jgi:hypothetical protein